MNPVKKATRPVANCLPVMLFVLFRANRKHKKAGATNKLQEIEKKSQFINFHLQTLEALKNDERKNAQRLLAEAFFKEPSFEEAIQHIHSIITDVDTVDIENRAEILAKEKSEGTNKLRLKASLFLAFIFVFILTAITVIFNLTIISSNKSQNLFILSVADLSSLNSMISSAISYMEW